MSTAAPALPPISKKTKIFAVVALAIAGAAFSFIALGGLGENLVYYWAPSDLRANADKAVGATIRLGGQVAPGTIVFDGTNKLAFEVTDGKANVPVKAEGVPPAMFRESIGVVVEGTMTAEGHFTSNRLMVSHDNEYRAPKEGEAYDAEKMIKQVMKDNEDGR
ncbi:cytochrome c maturation protein CcmE [Vulgatibacter sp.]|uniref:cytochrome c maturation protein CcmE n=1 Tax=Vulgatibacter sp. TaxID=1971226 RepID=UPI00356AF87C